MKKTINLFYLIIFFLFFFNVFRHYLSTENIQNINLNRINIEKILKDKILNLPVLKSDTNDVVEFNSSFAEEIKKDKPRSFWNLLKLK